MRFTSAKARDDFANLILHGVQPMPAVRELGNRLAKRLTEMNNGRMWMAGHMRRGDCKRHRPRPGTQTQTHAFS